MTAHYCIDLQLSAPINKLKVLTSNFPIRSKLPMNGLGLGPGMPCFVKTVYGAYPNLLQETETRVKGYSTLHATFSDSLVKQVDKAHEKKENNESICTER